MHVAHLERTGHYLTIKDNQIVQVTKILINFVIGITWFMSRPKYKIHSQDL